MKQVSMNVLSMLLACCSTMALSNSPLQSSSDRGVSVEFSSQPLQARDQEPLKFAFAIQDQSSGAPMTGVRPTAWVIPRRPGPAASGTSCVRKAATLLGGSLTNRPALDLNEYYVLALNDDASISVVDPRFGFGGSQLLALIDLESRGEDWVLSADGSALFVSMPEAGKIAVADTIHWKVQQNIAAGTKPRDLVLTPDGSTLWVLSEDGARAFAVNSRAPRHVIARSDLQALAFSADAQFAVLAAKNALLIADANSGAASESIALDLDPQALAYASHAQMFYAGDPRTGELAAVDLKARRIVAHIKATAGFSQLRFSLDGRYGFLPNPTHDIVEIFDTASNQIIRRAEVSDGPDQVTFSDRIAYFRRRESDTILMLSLDQLKLAKHGMGVALADFTGGEHAMGRGLYSALADSIVPAPDGPAMLVANPVDRAIYYYKEGMAAPMGGFKNSSREPRAVLVVDRRLREIAAGRYETTKILDEPGSYDVVFFLDTPRVVSCFALDVAPRPETLAKRMREVTVAPEPMAATVRAGAVTPIRFRLSDQAAKHPLNAEDVEIMAMLAPGIWQRRAPAQRMAAGVYEAQLTPPDAGVYYIWVSSRSAGLAINNPQFFVLNVE